MKRSLVVISLVVAAPLSARAQPGLTEPQPPPVEEAGDKSPGVALSLALFGTAASYAGLVAAANSGSGELALLGVGGIIVAPSLGHFYAGESGRGVGHSLVRLGAGGAMVAGALVWMEDCWFEEDCDGGAGPFIVIAGAVVGIGSTVYSIADAPAAAARHNEARRRRLVLTPAPIVGPDRSTGFGVHVGAQF